MITTAPFWTGGVKVPHPSVKKIVCFDRILGFGCSVRTLASLPPREEVVRKASKASDSGASFKRFMASTHLATCGEELLCSLADLAARIAARKALRNLACSWFLVIDFLCIEIFNERCMDCWRVWSLVAVYIGNT
ncbi:unnamed protein product [Microthlaspi erraticum]|uniref:Uncharacterized protein n=1 Tax=Microthlaspi erraticum TaxID=1685480 RepID=A0A6D2I4Q6_9BRAS|nr:unnamed protein product [Microthlaspi erraticum]